MYICWVNFIAIDNQIKRRVIVANEIIKSYFAGVFDQSGIATISVHNKGHALSITVMITLKSDEVILLLRQNWDCKVLKHDVRFLPIPALRFLTDIEPYLIYKKKRAEIIIQALQNINDNQILFTPKKYYDKVTEQLIPFYNQLNSSNSSFVGLISDPYKHRLDKIRQIIS